MNLLTIDWEKQLKEDEVGSFDGLDVVLLAGLQRLAREAGLISQELQVLTPSSNMVQAISTCVFKLDDTEKTIQFVGSADCHKGNTTAPFINYPTAVAESRAEARCLRKALGIRMLSSEEIGFRQLEVSPGNKIASNMVVAIEKLCDTKNVQVAEVLEKSLDSKRASEIFELSELNVEEGQQVMQYLNKLPRGDKSDK